MSDSKQLKLLNFVCCWSYRNYEESNMLFGNSGDTYYQVIKFKVIAWLLGSKLRKKHKSK